MEHYVVTNGCGDVIEPGDIIKDIHGDKGRFLAVTNLNRNTGYPRILVERFMFDGEGESPITYFAHHFGLEVHAKETVS
jgi:hypothetical protein